MIGTTSQQVSRARSNTARILALFSVLSLMAHGLFFPQEWLLFGFGLSVYVLLANSLRIRLLNETSTSFGPTDVLLLGMLFFSILGLIHPVKFKDGCIEALRWGILWVVYRLGVRISSDEIAKERLINYVQWLAMVVAIIGWLPWVHKVGGRLSSVFGYPNATAAFLGAVLLLSRRRKLVRIFLVISLFGTGSRAGVGIFLGVLMGQQILSFVTLPEKFQLKEKIMSLQLRGLGLILLGVAGTALMLLKNRAVWGNLSAWGFTSASWQERLVYLKDGVSLAWNAGGIPRAGGWMAFPLVQPFPYWTADPHSSIIHILLNQGIVGIVSVGLWGALILAQVRKTRTKKVMQSIVLEGVRGTNPDLRVWGALLFLILHSLVDVDFSFGTLGILFWMLYGSIQSRDKHFLPLFSKENQWAVNLIRKGTHLVILVICLVCGSALLNPALFDQERIWNTQARLGLEHSPTRSIILWNRSLNWDQTQIGTRREQAEFLFKSGNTNAGLKAVEEVLRWQSYDLEAYEWAQSVVWEAAEEQRRRSPEIAIMLYLWVVGVPQKIELRAAALSSADQSLWKGHQSFLPSQHIKLLTEYARQRQLTLLLPRT